jgi:hypothetical protein
MIQDKKYTKSEFINSIRSKYPQYDNVEDDVLYDKILQKYPVYRDMISEQPDELKKKQDFASEEVELDFSLVKDSSDIKKSIAEEEYDKGDYEFDDRFSAGVNQVLASVSRIPQFVAEQSATALAAFDPDFRKKLNSLSREERDIILSGATGLAGPMNITGLTQASKEYSEKAEKIAESFEKFDTSITEDIKAGDLGQALGRLGNEAVGAIPSMIQAFIPAVGIPSIALGSAAEKSKELQDRGYDLNLKTSTNSILTGTAEGLSDYITKRIGGRFFDSVVGKGKDFTIKTVKSFAKSFGIDFAQEGGSEAGSLFVSKAADAIISGDKEAFQDSLYEFTDTFLVGGFATGPLSGGRIGTDIVRQNVRKRRVDNKIKESNYKSTSDAFSRENTESVDASQLDIVRSKGAREILEFELSERVNKGIITKEDADQRLKSFDEISSLSKATDGLNLDSEKEQRAINLLKEKKNLQDAIKDKDESLVKPQQDRINEINDELSRVQDETLEQVEDTPVEETVAEQTITEETTERVSPELEQKLTYKTSGRTQVILDDSGKFQKAVDQKTGKERTSKKSIKDAQDELIKQKDYTTGKSAFDGIPTGQEISDPSQLIADRSENPQEVAKEYFEAREREGTVDPIIDFFVGRYKVDPKSLPEYYDSKDDLKEVLAYTIKKKGEIATPLDGIAQEVSEMTNQEVTPEQLFQIMKDPRYKSNRAPKEPEVVLSLRNRFIELTGLYGTDKQMKDVADQDPSQLKPPVEPVEVAQEQAAKQEELEVEEKIEQAEDQAKKEKDAAAEPKADGITGRILDAFKKTKDFLKKQAKIHFTAQGLQPDAIYKERQKRDANIRMYQNRIDRMRKNINSALKKIPKDQRDSVMKEFDQVFRGQVKSEDSNLSIDMRILANRMRMEIDGLSNMIIESGYFDTKEGLEAVQKNIGSYVNRSYRLFSDSNWANKVSEEVKENAKRFFRRQAIQEGRTVSEQEIENQINEILSKAEDNKYIVKGKDGRIDKDILRRRKDIPAELRALMGEVTNPLENYQNTVAKQAMLLFNYKFQKKIAESGSNTFFTKSPTKENTVQIVKEGNEAYPELAGLWTTPEIAKTFEMPNPINGHYDAFVKFSSAVKWGKTVGSIATHAKNILGNHGFVLMNGHLDWNEFTNAADLVIKEFRGKTTEEQRAYLDELISLGIVKQSTTLGDITSMYGDKSFEEAYKRTIIDEARNVASKKQKLSDLFRESKAGKTTKALVDKLNDAYQSEDDFFKIMAYGIEKQRYAKALFGKDKADLTKAESDQVNEVVSEIVKNTYPTYDRVPPIIKRLGRSPVLGAFVSFRAESIRTAFNTYKIALNEVKSNNKEVSKIGAKRLASAGLYTGLKVTLATQLGLAAKSFIFGGEDDESQEYNDLRKFVPSWSQDSLIAVTSKEPGKYTFIDLTANDPHSFLSELIIAGRNDNDSTPLLIDKLVALGEPFLGKDLVFSFASEAYLVSNDKKLTTGEKGDKIMEQFLKLIQPGTITTAMRLQKAASGNDNNVSNEAIGAFTGYRPVDLDIQKSYLFRAIDLKDRKASLNGRYNRVRYNEKSTEVELNKAYEEVNRDYSQMIKEAQELTQSAVRLGVDSGEIVNILKKNGFSRRDIAFILSEEEYTYIPTKMRR